jgi:hypothetical protein
MGVAGSVVRIASLSIQLCKALYQFTSETRTANESLVAVRNGIHATTCALDQVHGFLEEEVNHMKTKSQATFFTSKSIQAVKRTADECLIIFWRIEATVTNKSRSKQDLIVKLDIFNEKLKEKEPPPLTVDKNLTSMSIWDRLRWPLITYKLEQFNSQIQSRQANLVLIFSLFLWERNGRSRE